MRRKRERERVVIIVPSASSPGCWVVKTEDKSTVPLHRHGAIGVVAGLLFGEPMPAAVLAEGASHEA